MTEDLLTRPMTRAELDILVSWAAKEGEQQPKLMSAGLHSRISGHPARADAIVRFFEYVLAHEQVWICRRAEVADHWRLNFKD